MMTYKLRTRLILITTAVTIGLSGCSNDMSDLHEHVKKARAQKKTKVAPLPVIKPHETYRYNSSGLRNPFLPVIDVFNLPTLASKGKKNRGLHPEENRPREELESYPLDTMRMVGILKQKETSWALVRTQDGTIHRVKAGHYMGQNHGKIMRVTESGIELREIVPDGIGGWTERQAEIALSEQS